MSIYQRSICKGLVFMVSVLAGTVDLYEVGF